jgi:hypothetical protein
MDLRGGQAKPANILQGFDHIGDQAAHFWRCGVCHCLGPLQQHGVAQTGDFQNGHDIPATGLGFSYNSPEKALKGASGAANHCAKDCFRDGRRVTGCASFVLNQRSMKGVVPRASRRS